MPIEAAGKTPSDFSGPIKELKCCLDCKLLGAGTIFFFCVFTVPSPLGSSPCLGSQGTTVIQIVRRRMWAVSPSSDWTK